MKSLPFRRTIAIAFALASIPALLAAVPAAGSTKTTSTRSGTLTIKAPVCGSDSGPVTTITSAPARDRFVVMIAAYTGGLPGTPKSKALAVQTYFKATATTLGAKADATRPFGVKRSIGVLVFTGQRVWVVTGYGSAASLTAGAARTSFIVRKCPKPRTRFTG